jgi:putative hemolysin
MNRGMPPRDRTDGPAKPAGGRLFAIDLKPTSPLLRQLCHNAGPSLERILGLDGINDIYRAATGAKSPKEFADGCLKYLQIRYRVAQADLAKIPRTGPVVVVANHPFGGIEGVMLASLLPSIRPDVKIMANFLLDRIPELRELFILVDPFERDISTAANIRPMREALRHLKNGGMLVVFPAGEVSHLQLRRREIADSDWNDNVARLVRHTKSPVLPIYFDGANGPLFQIMGLISSRLRTAMLPREVLNKRGRRFEIRVGTLVPWRKIESYETDAELTAALRQRVYTLRHRAPAPHAAPGAAAAPAPAEQRAIVPPVPPETLQAELAALPASCLQVDGDEFQVYLARAPQIPNVLREIGRLREITFRATGEGTGAEIDLDRFDPYYLHLFVWNRRRAEIVGAYRLGESDIILDRYGKEGLYTSTLFQYKTTLLRKLGPALELGRSFVRIEYQRSFQPLMLLWKGIGRLIADHPAYKTLFGPVSIANTYSPVSRQLMVQFLRFNHHRPDLSQLVQARNPFPIKRIAGFDAQAVRMLLKDGDDVSDLVSEVEPDQKGIPVLLRQYLKLGAKMIAFNVDTAFSDVVDALMVCDLTRTDRKLLERYMGKEGVQRFLAHHARPSDATPVLVDTAA